MPHTEEVGTCIMCRNDVKGPSEDSLQYDIPKLAYYEVVFICRKYKYFQFEGNISSCFFITEKLRIIILQNNILLNEHANLILSVCLKKGIPRVCSF